LSGSYAHNELIRYRSAEASQNLLKGRKPILAFEENKLI